MLFNSYVFILAFLPITLLAYALVGRVGGRRMALLFLCGASLFFYAWWNPPYVLLVLASIVFNYFMGVFQRRAIERTGRPSKVLMAGAVAANLGLLAYFKYANFFIRTVNAVADTQWGLVNVFLPLAISFFTFTQISYLVDIYRGEPSDYDFVDYCLFVVFFPHLIAGPIVRHHEILPQIHHNNGRLHAGRLPAGLTLFAFGLFSKAVLADSVAPYATNFFASVERGVTPRLLGSWVGALAYTSQLYFDFSGYSTMALGLAYFFDIKMPFNFNSPYKARNIIDFWRRWHMSLSRFLRDYLYIPLGGNRRGKTRRYVNLMITMLLGGLWHGAGWTFVIWGGLHGVYLCVNHGWAAVSKPWQWANSKAARAGYYLMTFLAVVVGWVFFRSPSLRVTGRVLAGMIGLNGVALPVRLDHVRALHHGAFHFEDIGFRWAGVGWVTALLLIAFLMPNVQQVMRLAAPSFEAVEGSSGLTWHLRPRWAFIGGAALAISLIAMASGVSEFLYFQF